MEDHPKWEREVKLEGIMLGEGIARYRRSFAGNVNNEQATMTQPFQELLHESLVPMGEAIKE